MKERRKKEGSTGRPRGEQNSQEKVFERSRLFVYRDGMSILFSGLFAFVMMKPVFLSRSSIRMKRKNEGLAAHSLL
jgi:hypothetical protein